MAAAAVTGVVGLYLYLRRRRSAVEEPALREACNVPSLAAVGDAAFTASDNILLVLSEVEGVAELAADFFGTVMTSVPSQTSAPFEKKTLFLVGDCSKADAVELEAADRVFVVAELSHGFDGQPGFRPVGLGRVPIRVHGVGVFYRRFFEPDEDGASFFARVQTEHAFQSLTESTKPGTAHRTGIYLTPVAEQSGEAHFRLLRCSTNFSGPTEGFGASDAFIVDALNHEADRLFGGRQARLNHVLAQIYHNTPAADGRKSVKAAIKGHSDKTKDMPPDGIMAFVTFYDADELAKLEPLSADAFDRGVRRGGLSGLTRLHFRLKAAAVERHGARLPSQFSLTLYPDSAFFMPLSTNRLYTHEIRPGALEAALLPTRMGYVVRCSAAEAIHRDGRTFLKQSDGELAPLQPSTAAGVDELRALYKQENSSIDHVDYGGRFLFSMNEGDYLRPTQAGAAPSAAGNDATPPADAHDGALPSARGFRSISLPKRMVLGSRLPSFEDLLAPVCLQPLGKGRRGAVLVRPHRTRGVPVVRTTTCYEAPAQSFAPVHARLAEHIQACAGLPMALNNALLEVYTNAYAKMGAHSDQALDLQDGTAIAVFSCYRHPDRATPPPRKLVTTPHPKSGQLRTSL